MIVKPYTPQSDSLPAKVVAFLVFNAGEETLTVDDIVQKFDCKPSGVHTALRAAKDAGLIVRERTEDGDYIYKLGVIPCAQPNPAPIKPTPAKPATNTAPKTTGAGEGKTSSPYMLDMSQLVVETGIPYTPIGNKGATKWDGIFNLLETPGQSVAVPARIKPALASAISKHNKKGGTTFRTAKTSRNEARVWRIT